MPTNTKWKNLRYLSREELRGTGAFSISAPITRGGDIVRNIRDDILDALGGGSPLSAHVVILSCLESIGTSIYRPDAVASLPERTSRLRIALSQELFRYWNQVGQDIQLGSLYLMEDPFDPCNHSSVLAMTVGGLKDRYPQSLRAIVRNSVQEVHGAASSILTPNIQVETAYIPLVQPGNKFLPYPSKLAEINQDLGCLGGISIGQYAFRSSTGHETVSR